MSVTTDHDLELLRHLETVVCVGYCKKGVSVGMMPPLGIDVFSVRRICGRELEKGGRFREERHDRKISRAVWVFFAEKVKVTRCWENETETLQMVGMTSVSQQRFSRCRPADLHRQYRSLKGVARGKGPGGASCRISCRQWK